MVTGSARRAVPLLGADELVSDDHAHITANSRRVVWTVAGLIG